MDIQPTALFQGIAEEDLDAMLHCLQARRTTFNKGNMILEIGKHTDDFALVLNGSVMIYQDDYWGNRNILSVFHPGDVFGESFAAIPESRINVSVVAETQADILFLNFTRILTTCSNSCEFHNRMLHNLFTILAQRNQKLNEKLTHISQRTTREKILSFLSAQARHTGKSLFDIPMNRQQMADFLSVDRSALSAELAKLKKDGLIDYHKSTFKVLSSKEP